MHEQRGAVGPVVLELADLRRRPENAVVRHQMMRVLVGGDAGHDVADAAEPHAAVFGIEVFERGERDGGGRLGIDGDPGVGAAKGARVVDVANGRNVLDPILELERRIGGKIENSVTG